MFVVIPVEIFLASHLLLNIDIKKVVFINLIIRIVTRLAIYDIVHDLNRYYELLEYFPPYDHGFCSDAH